MRYHTIASDPERTHQLRHGESSLSYVKTQYPGKEGAHRDEVEHAQRALAAELDTVRGEMPEGWTIRTEELRGHLKQHGVSAESVVRAHRRMRAQIHPLVGMFLHEEGGGSIGRIEHVALDGAGVLLTVAKEADEHQSERVVIMRMGEGHYALSPTAMWEQARKDYADESEVLARAMEGRDVVERRQRGLDDPNEIRRRAAESLADGMRQHLLLRASEHVQEAVALGRLDAIDALLEPPTTTFSFSEGHLMQHVGVAGGVHNTGWAGYNTYDSRGRRIPSNRA